MFIDFHTHILPKADHGSDSLERSLGQLKKAAAAGIETVVATPHFYPDKQQLDEFIRGRDASYDILREKTNFPRIVKATEVAISPGLEKLPELGRLCVGDTDLILLELPNSVWNNWIYDAIFEIKARRRLRPVIAHIDRYSRDAVKRLTELDLLLQVNAEGLISFGKRAYLMRMFSEGKAHLLGSDAHGEAEEYKAFVKAMKLLGDTGKIVMKEARGLLER